LLRRARPTSCERFTLAWARNAGLRIDHLLLGPGIAPRLARAEVDATVRGWEKASDHAPVWIEIADGGTPEKPRARRRRAAEA